MINSNALHRTPNEHVRLNNDILALIFSIDTDPFTEEHALDNLRRYAQVSAEWRQVILGAPRLWGHLIDLDAFGLQKSRDWPVEVVRRAGSSSSLWVKGTLKSSPLAWAQSADEILQARKLPSCLTDFFFSLLDAHWTRIQRLVIKVETQEIDSQQWNALRLPSPRLQEFSLTGDVEDIKITADFPIFANRAPLLSSFHAGNIGFHIQIASWLTHIRSISLGPFLNLSEMLTVLKMAPQIETLNMEIEEDLTNSSSASSGVVRLPNSKEVKIRSRMKPCLDFLASTVFSRDCSLDVFITTRSMVGLALDSVDAAISNLTEAYRPAERQVKFVIVPEAPRLTYWIDETFLSISVPHPDVFLDLHLALKFSSHWDAAEVEITTPPESADHESFSTAVVSVTHLIKLRNSRTARVLTTSQNGIYRLSKAQQLLGNVMLPAMTVLRFRGHFFVDPHLTSVAEFLHWRIVLGHPVHVLDLTEAILTSKGADQPDIRRDFIPTVATGVQSKVLWRETGETEIQEHDCRNI